MLRGPTRALPTAKPREEEAPESLARTEAGVDNRTRTDDLRITSALLMNLKGGSAGTRVSGIARLAEVLRGPLSQRSRSGTGGDSGL